MCSAAEVPLPTWKMTRLEALGHSFCLLLPFSSLDRSESPFLETLLVWGKAFTSIELGIA